MNSQDTDFGKNYSLYIKAPKCHDQRDDETLAQDQQIRVEIIEIEGTENSDDYCIQESNTGN